MIQTEKFNANKQFESLLAEFNDKLIKEKAIVINDVDSRVKSLLDQVIY